MRFALAFSLCLAACSASPNEQGGTPRFDASPPSPATSGDGGCGADSLDGGTTWGDLYADFFGPSGAASCAGTPGGCHGDSSSAGAGTWVCGATQNTCYTGLTSAGLVSPTSDPTSTLLYSALRKQCGGGLNAMPQSPPFVFTPSDMARIEAWISAGTPND